MRKSRFRVLVDVSLGSVDGRTMKQALLSYLHYLNSLSDDELLNEIVKMYSISVSEGVERHFMSRVEIALEISKYASLYGLSYTSIVNRALSRYLGVELPTHIEKRKRKWMLVKVRRSVFDMLEELASERYLSVSRMLDYIAGAYYDYFEKLPASYKLQELIAMNNIHARRLHKREEKAQATVYVANRVINDIIEKYNLPVSSLVERMVAWYYFYDTM